MTDDAALLRRYAGERSEPAFTEFVHRHVDLVYAGALRRCGGDTQLAAEAAQHVFLQASRQAAVLARHPMLTGWLYAATRNAALNLLRAQRRRRAHESAAHAMNELLASAAPEPDWNRLGPLLDAALDQLGARDREAVLLRFFENRSFAEVGTRLQLTENAARMRVERALDRLQALLARRGLTSTAAALGTVLASQGAMGAPSGLATSIAGAALAAPAASVALLTFMNLKQIASGVIGVALLLVLSLSFNTYLLLAPPPSALAGPVASVATAGARPPSAAAPAPANLSLASLANAEAATVRDQLRAAGVDAASIRATLEGLLRRRYREVLSQNRAERLRRGWWRDSQRTWGTAEDPQRLIDDPTLLREMVSDPLEQALGPDPADVAAADARYAFLPPELRQAFGALDRQRRGGWSGTGNPEADLQLKADYEENNRRVDASRAELVARLTPEQRAEYDLHLSALATGLARQLTQAEPSEAEFRAVFPLAQGYLDQMAALADKNRAGDAATALQLQLAQQLIAAIGLERARDLIWSGAGEYPAYARIAREANLPPDTAGRILQLAAETGEKAAAVHADPSLTADEKKAALLALQGQAQPQLDELLPPAAQQRVAPNALTWLTGLGQGSYRLMAASMPGETNLLSAGQSVSVVGPPPAARLSRGLAGLLRQKTAGGTP